jgi:hypothetical protein
MLTPAVLPSSLTRVVPWAHALLAPALRPGDLAVDLTAGRGRDTLFLFEQVGRSGRVVAFDTQAEALQRTAALLSGAGAAIHQHGSTGRADLTAAGIHLFAAGHQHLADCLADAPQVVIANLGFLPGGSPTLTTTAATTALALEQACALLAPGGRLAVVTYPGHPGGEVEAATVETLFFSLPPARWQTLRLAVPNARGAPLLLVAQKS